MSPTTVRAAVSGTLATLLALSAPAQDPTFLPGTDPMDFAQRTTSWTNTLIGNQMVQRSVERWNGKGRRPVRRAPVRRASVSPTRVAVGSASSLRGLRAVPAGAASLSYCPSAAIRAEAKRAFVARIAGMNPAVGPKLAQAMKTFDMFAAYSKMVGDEGYRRDNVADAMASTLVVAWVGSRGKALDPDNEGQRVIRSRVATALAADPRFRSAAFRQRLGDEMQLTTVFLASGLGGAIQQGSTATYARAMGALFKGLTGTDASRVRITSRGFVPA